MSTHSSTLAGKSPWTEDLVGCNPWARNESDGPSDWACVSTFVSSQCSDGESQIKVFSLTSIFVHELYWNLRCQLLLLCCKLNKLYNWWKNWKIASIQQILRASQENSVTESSAVYFQTSSISRPLCFCLLTFSIMSCLGFSSALWTGGNICLCKLCCLMLLKILVLSFSGLEQEVS